MRERIGSVDVSTPTDSLSATEHTIPCPEPTLRSNEPVNTATVPRTRLHKPTRLALTPGDPAGIGPDLAVMLSVAGTVDQVVIIADEGVLTARAKLLSHEMRLSQYQPNHWTPRFELLHIECPFPVSPGTGDPRHAGYLINTLNRAIEGCLTGEFEAMVTGPINKEMMQRGGFSFMGHTEYIADQTGAHCPVMLLTSDTFHVALATTHLPLREVSKHITCERIASITRILHKDLVERFGMNSPHIGICGLNPHAGEGGRLGHEEIEEIAPAIEILRREGISAAGPLSADTIFTKEQLARFDVVLAMYHDQGLPVIKYGGFGKIVNVTLGLPIIRTSVDHGTAYDIAGRGTANVGSIQRALQLASQLTAGSRA